MPIAISLITFGFAIYKFGEELVEKNVAPASRHWLGSRNFALILIGSGLVALVLATIENRRHMKELRREFGTQFRSLSVLFAALICCLGLISFVAVLFQE
jgi:uncharacterized membrane protein YidH (DUF202 family)